MVKQSCTGSSMGGLSPKNSPRKLASPYKRTPTKAASNNKFAPSKPPANFDVFEELQKVLRMRISQVQNPPVISGYDAERKQLHDLIQRTASTGESNSQLLIGPRGCGKTMLMDHVIKEVQKNDSAKHNLLVVRLNGLLQTDDKVALREITVQLQLENAVGDRVFGSFAETLQFLLAALKTGNQGSKPILFILEEFDLFAQHKNQTLLYNLFDVTQSAQTPLCVIGLTCRLDVVELLEKRVKSRFSHRQLHLYNKLSLAQYRGLCEDYLSMGSDFPDQGFAGDWNSSVKNLLQEVSVKDILERQFSLSNDVRGLLNLLTYPVCRLSTAHPKISAGDLINSFKMMSTDTKSAMLHGISILELCLIIAMKHLTEIYEGEPFNFEMVYSEYLKFAKKRSGLQVYEKAVVMKAYEHLQMLELVRGQGGGQGQREYRLMTLLVHPTQILDALQHYPGCPTEVKQWAMQSIN